MLLYATRIPHTVTALIELKCGKLAKLKITAGELQS